MLRQLSRRATILHRTRRCSSTFQQDICKVGQLYRISRPFATSSCCSSSESTSLSETHASTSTSPLPTSGIVSKSLTSIENLRDIKPGQRVTLAGWLTQIRIISKHLAFAVLLLPRGRGRIQLIVRSEDSSSSLQDIPALWDHANVHGVVQVEGTFIERPEKDQKVSKSQSSIAHNATQSDVFARFELNVSSCTILNSVPVDTLPFNPTDFNRETNEESRMRNRHLDLRNPRLGDNIRLRSKVTWAVRQYLHEAGFDEIETPILLRSTPEGAREYLVPTRLPTQSITSSSKFEPQFYALQQSPQQPKQLLMASGVTDRYYQIARCFRDEGGRKDRQPEFTQIDLEMSFVQGQRVSSKNTGDWTLGGEEIRHVIENMIRAIWKAAGREAELNAISQDGFQIMTYDEAMTRFGSDKPDLRYGLELVQISDALLTNSDLSKEDQKGEVEILCFNPAEGEQTVTRKDIDRMLEVNNVSGNDGVEAFWVDADSINASVKLLLRKSKHIRNLLDQNEVEALDVSVESMTDVIEEAKKSGEIFTKEHDANWASSFVKGGKRMCIFVAPRSAQIEGGSTTLGDVRRFLMAEIEAKKLLQHSLDECKPRFLWVIEFPLFTRADPDKDFLAKGRWSSSHHPFTSPKAEDIEKVMSLLQDNVQSRGESDERALASIKGQHYDLVLNGVEIGGGSVRIHDAELQRRILRNMLQLSHEEVQRFDHLLRALSHGAPPHAGIALGLDRLMSILCRSSSIRDVLAFPKSNMGRDLLFGSPDVIDVPNEDAGSQSKDTAQKRKDEILAQYGLRKA
ncbi:hypothetical protein L7F22_039130 [Adiantum nelumboides]|nr:hypothetical protein [Adiantum nelumboides]